ncbi:MAG: hypothetical protein Q4A01_06435, partial [Coriobacteriales bacterium]|nr:hypothetical protein [Coriobacteriales bacterium]
EAEAQAKAEAEARAKAEAEAQARVEQIKAENKDRVAALPNLTNEQRTELAKLYIQRDVLAIQGKTLPDESLQRISELEALTQQQAA